MLFRNTNHTWNITIDGCIYFIKMVYFDYLFKFSISGHETIKIFFNIYITGHIFINKGGIFCML